MNILKSEQSQKMEKARKSAKYFCLKEEERINTVLEELNERGKIDEQFLKSIKKFIKKIYQLDSFFQYQDHHIIK